MNGFVYLFDAGDLVKIGKSIDPKTRMVSVEREAERKILRHFIPPDCSNYDEIERLMHQKFAERRVDGEWFNEAAAKKLSA